MNPAPALVVVDDHPLFRQGLKQLIERAGQCTIAGEAGDGPAGLQLILAVKPDIAILDLSLPGLSGLDIAQQVQQAGLRTRVIILTMHKEEETFNRAMDLGVMGFVLKENAVEDIAKCVAAVARGEHYLSPSISSYLVRRHTRAEELASHRPGLETLTKAERRILRMVAEKKTSPQIAAELFISPRTVEAHRANVCAKLGLHGSHSLLLFALENRSSL
ncbi:MAG TPA: response regulator transcription factor [Opitutaceae bacterium]|jgi:DNA-binding NarL/FixJ family response regulator|nr:response regulator transcription factor [Opitutaceae bacterium]